MCPICWINGLIAFFVGIGLLAVDSPFTPFAIFLGVVLTIYALWKLREGYRKGKGFTKEQRTQNWKSIKRFTYGLVVGVVMTSAVFYIMDKDHHGEMNEVHEKHGY